MRIGHHSEVKWVVGRPVRCEEAVNLLHVFEFEVREIQLRLAVIRCWGHRLAAEPLAGRTQKAAILLLDLAGLRKEILTTKFSGDLTLSLLDVLVELIVK